MDITNIRGPDPPLRLYATVNTVLEKKDSVHNNEPLDRVHFSAQAKNSSIIRFDKIDSSKVWDGLRVDEGGRDVEGNDINWSRYVSRNESLIKEKSIHRSNEIRLGLYNKT